MAVAIVINHQGALIASTVGVSEDVLVHLARIREEVVEQEVAALGKEPAALEQRGNLAFMALDHPGIGVLVVARALVLHAVLFGEALDLAVAEHGQAGQRGHHRRNSEAFIALAELIDGRALVGIAHEVHVALHDVGVELQRVLDDRAVLGVVLVAQHHHEGAVVNAMHAQRANEVALHQPEGLGQQQRARHFGGHAIHHLAPELMRHGLIELGLAHAVLGARRNCAARSRPRKPQPVKVPLGQRHRRVKADHGKEARHVQNRLDHLLADGWIQVVELRRVVPGKAGAVVAVVDVAGFAALQVAAAEDHRGVRLLIVVVLDLDLHARVTREVGAVKAVNRIGRIWPRDEPFRLLDHPRRIDAHVVGNHVAGQPNTVQVSAVAQIRVSRLAAQIFGNCVVEERIGRSHRVRIAAEQLDCLGGSAALPDADQPQRIQPARGERGELLVWNLIEAGNRAPILPAHLRQPHVGALGDQHDGRHPGGVGRELLIFVRRIAEDGNLGGADHVRPLLLAALAMAPGGFAGLHGGRVELHPDSQLFLMQNLAGDQQVMIQAVAQHRLPQLANQRQLLAERARRAHRRRPQQLQQVHRLGAGERNQRAGCKIIGKLPRHLAIHRPLGQRLFLEKLLEGLKGFIAVGGPQQQQLLQRDGPVRCAIRLSGKPLARRHLAADHRSAGKLLDKGQQHPAQRLGAHNAGKPLQRLAHDRRVEPLAVTRHQHVAGLVDQAHRVELAGMNRLLGMLLHLAYLVDAVGKFAASGHIGKNHVPRVGEQRIRELVAFTRLPGYMELHHNNRTPKDKGTSIRSRSLKLFSITSFVTKNAGQ